MTDTEVQPEHEHDHAHDVERVRGSNSGTNGASTRAARRSVPHTNSTSSSKKERDKSILVADDTKALVVDAATTTGRSHDAVVKIAMTYYAARKGWKPKVNDDEWVEAELAEEGLR